MPEELDTVELTEAVDGWPEGTPGTVVDVPADGFVTIEIDNELVDPDTSLLEALLDVPASLVRVTERHAQHA